MTLLPDAGAAIRRRYPIIDAFDSDPGAPLDLDGFELLDGSIERRRAALEAALGAAIVVYAPSHRVAPDHGHHLCQRAAAATLTAGGLSALRRFEDDLGPGQVACAYRRAHVSSTGSSGNPSTSAPGASRNVTAAHS